MSMRKEPAALSPAATEEIERPWQHIDIGPPAEPVDSVMPSEEWSRERHSPFVWIAVIAIGVFVGGFVLYQVIELQKAEAMRQALAQADIEMRKAMDGLNRDVAAVGARTAAERAALVEQQRREAEQRVAYEREQLALRQAQVAAANELAARKERAWQRFYQPSATCSIDANKGSVACANEFARAKSEFEQKWAEGKLR